MVIHKRVSLHIYETRLSFTVMQNLLMDYIIFRQPRTIVRWVEKKQKPEEQEEETGETNQETTNIDF
jgi:hypothetical protein